MRIIISAVGKYKFTENANNILVMESSLIGDSKNKRGEMIST